MGVDCTVDVPGIYSLILYSFSSSFFVFFVLFCLYAWFSFSPPRLFSYTRHGHKSTVTCTKFNRNGNWLLTASRDHLLKLWDIRMMKEITTFRGHKKEIHCELASGLQKLG